jgi:hypothetical protein
MENQRDDLVVILAGYKEPMDKFYESNPGLSSRISNHVDFPDFETDELLQIAELFLQDQQYCFTDDAKVSFREYIELRKQEPLFANARSISNALNRARMRQANRIFLMGDQPLNKADLVTIKKEDVVQSSLFSS